MRKVAESICDINLLPNNIVKLKGLTKALEFAGIVKPVIPAEIKELKMDKGTSYMVGLYKSDIIAVARNFASAETAFPEHFHDEWELLIVYEGKMTLYINNKTKILIERDFYYVLPNQKHSAYFDVNTWFLAITMPASESWPKGG